jgi:hypothetical protein
MAIQPAVQASVDATGAIRTVGRPAFFPLRDSSVQPFVEALRPILKKFTCCHFALEAPFSIDGLEVFTFSKYLRRTQS